MRRLICWLRGHWKIYLDVSGKVWECTYCKARRG